MMALLYNAGQRGRPDSARREEQGLCSSQGLLNARCWGFSLPPTLFFLPQPGCMATYLVSQLKAGLCVREQGWFQEAGQITKNTRKGSERLTLCTCALPLLPFHENLLLVTCGVGGGTFWFAGSTWCFFARAKRRHSPWPFPGQENHQVSYQGGQSSLCRTTRAD